MKQIYDFIILHINIKIQIINILILLVHKLKMYFNILKKKL